MGELSGSFEMNFNGTEHEEKMLGKLLQLMDKEWCFDEEDYEDFPLSLFDFCQNALLGVLEDRGENSEYFTRYWPDCNLELAPKLIAALFPNSTFECLTEWVYSVGDDKKLLVKYKEGKLYMYFVNLEAFEDEEDGNGKSAGEKYNEIDLIWTMLSS